MSSTATKGLMYHRFDGGDQFTRTDGSTFNRYSTTTARNLNASKAADALLIAVPSKFNDLFLKSY